MSDRTFKPKKLGRESVEAPLEPHWRVMGAEQEKKLHEKAKADFRRFQAFGPRMRRRLLAYALGTAAGFAAVGFFLVSGTLHALAVFGGVGAALGIAVAFLRPTDYLCGLLYALGGIAASVLLFGGLGFAGRLMTLLIAMSFGTIGIALGRVEEFKRIDGED